MKTKYLTGVFLFIFWALAVALITASLLSAEKKNNLGGQNSILNNSGIIGPVNLTMAEVAKHNSASDCWSIISGQVYNLTSLIYSHSGGSQTILSVCGRDGTTAFLTKDRTPGVSHSGGAESILQAYYLGDLGATINLSASQQQILNTPPPRSKEDD
ncbi:MAG: cytochrome b5-like heme/steroid binding domain-containing protein [Patescibacteria group bacterium]|nr:cytochrome b5-like heme/steroid binding domain-containing protein [Patescibacteria group bacterium]